MKILKSALIVSAIFSTSLVADEVLATINGVPITKSNVDFILKNSRTSFDKLTDEQKKELLDRLIERELLVEAAKKDGIEKDEEYKRALENYKKDLLIKVWMDKLYNKTLVSDSEANKFYQENKEMFKKPETIHARHILVKTKEEAQKIIDELKGLKGEELKKKFIELAKSKSTGPSGKSGGDLGYFPRGQMVKPFEEAAFKLNKGEITTEPVKTQFGYHVIYVEDKKPATITPFEEVKESIISRKKEEEFKKLIKETIDKAKKEAKIEINLKTPEKKGAK
ncbi:MAG: peptidylprolyl isomerase [Epsilonproteobacteria bacterium]|nr:peptidylprolyl isomerase [Campylobacterota bacterium]